MKTLPETQGFESITWIIFLIEINLKSFQLKKIIQVLNSIPWVRCASGNNSSTFFSSIFFNFLSLNLFSTFFLTFLKFFPTFSLTFFQLFVRWHRPRPIDQTPGTPRSDNEDLKLNGADEILGEKRIWKLERCILATTCDSGLVGECCLHTEKDHDDDLSHVLTAASKFLWAYNVQCTISRW